MLKRKLCEAVFTWELTCDGPLLIGDGRYEKEEVMKPFEKNEKEKKKRNGWHPDNFFVNRMERNPLIDLVRDSGPNAPQISTTLQFYVPGTSIRGPFRSQAERIIRTLLNENSTNGNFACDPFEDNKDSQMASCSKRLQENDPKENKPYNFICPACKLFGCAGQASRIIFSDADIKDGKSVYRDMIGIDRFTGGVSTGGDDGGGANMRVHAIENATFTTTITVTNFELWQLGLLAYLFRDFEEKRVSIGHGKTKGFGRIKGEIKEMIFFYPRNDISQIEHMGSLMGSEAERSAYGIKECQAPLFTGWEKVADPLSLYTAYRVKDQSKTMFWETVAPKFNDEMNRLTQETP